MTRKRLLYLFGAVLTGAAVAGCSFLPASPTPFQFPEPNLTATALFQQPTLTIPPSVTPPIIQTATPVEASPTFELAATALPTLTPGAGSQTPSQRPGPSVEAFYLASPPNIDGQLDEWNLIPVLANSVVYGSSAHSGLADLSANFMVGWDENYLYLAATVTDDVYAQSAGGRQLFRGDSLEILLDTDLSSDYFVAGLSPDDFQLGISPGSAAPGQSPEAYLWYPRSIEGSRPEVKIAARATSEGYQIEAAIPWKVFEMNPVEGRRYGFGFAVSDNDNTAADVQQSMVSNVPTRRLTAPTTWGNLVLRRP